MSQSTPVLRLTTAAVSDDGDLSGISSVRLFVITAQHAWGALSPHPDNERFAAALPPPERLQGPAAVEAYRHSFGNSAGRCDVRIELHGAETRLILDRGTSVATLVLGGPRNMNLTVEGPASMLTALAEIGAVRPSLAGIRWSVPSETDDSTFAAALRAAEAEAKKDVANRWRAANHVSDDGLD